MGQQKLFPIIASFNFLLLLLLTLVHRTQSLEVINKKDLTDPVPRRLSHIFPESVQKHTRYGNKQRKVSEGDEAETDETPVFSLEKFETLDTRLLNSFIRPYRHTDDKLKSLKTSTVEAADNFEIFSISRETQSNFDSDFRLDMSDTESMMKFIAGTSKEFKKKFLTLLLQSDREGLLDLVRNMISYHKKNDNNINIIEDGSNFSNENDEKSVLLTSADKQRQNGEPQLLTMTKFDDESHFVNRQGVVAKNDPEINSAILLHRESSSTPGHFVGSRVGNSKVESEKILTSKRNQGPTIEPANVLFSSLPLSERDQNNANAIDILKFIDTLNGMRGTPTFEKIMDTITALAEHNFQPDGTFSTQSNSESSLQISKQLHGQSKTFSPTLQKIFNSQTEKTLDRPNSNSKKSSNIGVPLPNLDNQINVQLSENLRSNNEINVEVLQSAADVNNLFRPNFSLPSNADDSDVATRIADVINNRENQVIQNNFGKQLSDTETSSFNGRIVSQSFGEFNGQAIVPLSSDIEGQLDPEAIRNFRLQTRGSSIGNPNFRDDDFDDNQAGSFVPLSSDFEGQFSGVPLPTFTRTQTPFSIPNSEALGVPLPTILQENERQPPTASNLEFGRTESNFALQSIGVPLSSDDPNFPPPVPTSVREIQELQDRNVINSVNGASSTQSQGNVEQPSSFPDPNNNVLPPIIGGFRPQNIGVPLPDISSNSGPSPHISSNHQSFGVPLPDPNVNLDNQSQNTGIPVRQAVFNFENEALFSENVGNLSPNINNNFDFSVDSTSAFIPSTQNVGVPLPNLDTKNQLQNSFSTSKANNLNINSKPSGGSQVSENVFIASLPNSSSGASQSNFDIGVFQEFGVNLPNVATPGNLNQNSGPFSVNNPLFQNFGVPLPSLANLNTNHNFEVPTSNSNLHSTTHSNQEQFRLALDQNFNSDRGLSQGFGIPLPNSNFDFHRNSADKSFSTNAGQTENTVSTSLQSADTRLINPDIPSKAAISSALGIPLPAVDMLTSSAPTQDQFLLKPVSHSDVKTMFTTFGQRVPGITQSQNKNNIKEVRTEKSNQMLPNKGNSVGRPPFRNSPPVEIRPGIKTSSNIDTDSDEILFLDVPVEFPSSKRIVKAQRQNLLSLPSFGVPLPHIGSSTEPGRNNKDISNDPVSTTGQFFIRGSNAKLPDSFSSFGVPLPQISTIVEKNNGNIVQNNVRIKQDSVEKFSAEDAVSFARVQGKNIGQEDIDNGNYGNKGSTHKFVTFLTPGLIFPFNADMENNDSKHSYRGKSSEERAKYGQGKLFPSYTYTAPPLVQPVPEKVPPVVKSNYKPECVSKTMILTTVLNGGKQTQSVTTLTSMVTSVHLVTSQFAMPVTVVRTMTAVRQVSPDKTYGQYDQRITQTKPPTLPNIQLSSGQKNHYHGVTSQIPLIEQLQQVPTSQYDVNSLLKTLQYSGGVQQLLHQVPKTTPGQTPQVFKLQVLPNSQMAAVPVDISHLQNKQQGASTSNRNKPLQFYPARDFSVNATPDETQKLYVQALLPAKSFELNGRLNSNKFLHRHLNEQSAEDVDDSQEREGQLQKTLKRQTRDAESRPVDVIPLSSYPRNSAQQQYKVKSNAGKIRIGQPVVDVASLGSNYVIRTKLIHSTFLRTITTAVPTTIVSAVRKISTVYGGPSLTTIRKTSVICVSPGSQQDNSAFDGVAEQYAVGHQQTPPLPTVRLTAKSVDNREVFIRPTTGFKTDPGQYRTWVGTLHDDLTTADSSEDLKVPSKFVLLQHMWPKGFIIEGGSREKDQHIRIMPAVRDLIGGGNVESSGYRKARQIVKEISSVEEPPPEL